MTRVDLQIYQRLSEEAGNGLEETQGRCTDFLLKFRKYLTHIYRAKEDLEKVCDTSDCCMKWSRF